MLLGLEMFGIIGPDIHILKWRKMNKIMFLIFLLLPTLAFSKVLVPAFTGGYPVSVCQPNDIVAGCVGGGGGSGNVGIGTTNRIAKYIGSTTIGSPDNVNIINGNVGIGTTLPSSMLTAQNDIYSLRNIFSGSSNVMITAPTPNGSKGMQVVGTNTQGIEGLQIQNKDANGLSGILFYDDSLAHAGGIIYGNSGGFGGIIPDSLNFIMSNGNDTIDIGGNLGLSVSVPINVLDVNGAEAIGAYAGNNTAPINGLIVSGNVGIGSSNPQSALDVNGQILAANSGSFGAPGFAFNNGYKSTGIYWFDAAPTIGFSAGSVPIGHWNATALSIVTGNVGIGTITTNASLDINGSFKLEKNGAASGYVLTSNSVGIGTWMPSGAGIGSFVDTFTNADLTAGVLTVTHNLGVKNVVVQVYNNLNKQIQPDFITLIDNNSLTIDLNSFGAIAGTWHAVVLDSGSNGNVGGGDIVANTDLLGQSGDIPTVLTYTPAVTGTYDIGQYVNVIAGADPIVMSLHVTFHDENNTPQNLDLTDPSIILYFAGNPKTIRAFGGSPITLSITASSGGGLNYDIGAYIRKDF